MHHSIVMSYPWRTYVWCDINHIIHIHIYIYIYIAFSDCQLTAFSILHQIGLDWIGLAWTTFQTLILTYSVIDSSLLQYSLIHFQKTRHSVSGRRKGDQLCLHLETEIMSWLNRHVGMNCEHSRDRSRTRKRTWDIKVTKTNPINP